MMPGMREKQTMNHATPACRIATKVASAALALVVDSLRRADRTMLTDTIHSVSLDRRSVAGLLRRNGAPPLIATGSEDPGFTPDQARAAAALIPGARVAAIDGAAYLAPFEQPAATAELLLDLWRAA